MAESTRAKHIDNRSYKESAAKVVAFENFVKETQVRNIQLYVLVSPGMKIRKYNAIRTADSILQKYDLTAYNYSELFKADAYDLFYDGAHLNELGAKEFTSTVVAAHFNEKTERRSDQPVHQRSSYCPHAATSPAQRDCRSRPAGLDPAIPLCDHLPYYRQVKMLNRYEENIVNTSTMGRWVKESINLLAIIYSRMKEKVLLSDYLMADETTINVLDPHKSSGKHQGYIWGYLAPLLKLTVMDYAEGRAADYPEKFIGDYSGVFQTDAYGGYDKLLKDKKDIIHTGCWVHTRRNFFKMITTDKKRATEALNMIGGLYAVESEAKKEGVSEQELLRMRQEHSLPLLAELKGWAHKQVGELNPKAAIAEACRYMLKRWGKLIHYTSDGRLLPDTNLLEGRFRGPALGRKNWLFAGNTSLPNEQP